MVIIDTTEEESDATKKGQENSTEENRIGQEGERRKSYSAAVIDGIKRNSRSYVGDSIVRKTDTRLNKEEIVVVCLPGARIEHVTERVEKIIGRGKRGTILVHIGTNNADHNNIIIIMAGMAVFLHGWLPHRGNAQMACTYCFPTRTMF